MGWGSGKGHWIALVAGSVVGDLEGEREITDNGRCNLMCEPPFGRYCKDIASIEYRLV